MSNLPKTLRFEDTELSIIDRDGKPWVAATQIGSALGYTQKDEVSRIYRRHAEEFTSDMTQTARLAFRGGEAVTRIFSPRGCHLIAMFARTKKAKAFRRWVLDVLDGLVPAVPATRLVTDLPRWLRREINARAYSLSRVNYYDAARADLTRQAVALIDQGEEVRVEELAPSIVEARPDDPAYGVTHEETAAAGILLGRVAEYLHEQADSASRCQDIVANAELETIG